MYSTYFGGSASQDGLGIATDSSGNVYFTGNTDSTDFPVSSGAFQKTYGGQSSTCESGTCGDAFITKFNSSGTAVVYSTYIGGSDDETGYAIAVDSAGDAYITGVTDSLNFPTTAGAFQTTCDACNYLTQNTDAFVTELNPTGSALVYSTYLGGSKTDSATGIAVDASGDAYVAGGTSSANFPVTTGAYQTKLSNQINNAFISKLNPTGTELVYSTYLGGSVQDEGPGNIALDASGDAYVAGITSSPDFPVTAGTFSIPFGTNPSGYSSYLTKLNSTGSDLTYSLLLPAYEAELTVDSSGDAYVVGGADQFFPTTAGALDGFCQSGAFLSEFNPSASTLISSAYLCDQPGSQSSAYSGFLPRTVAVDPSGYVYIGGVTTDTAFPATVGALQTQLANVCCFSDAYLTKLTPDGTALAYSTYLGGNGDDDAKGLSVDASGNAYITGYTESSNFPTASPIQGSLSGSSDAFVSKLSTASSASLSAWPAVLSFGSQGVGYNSLPLDVTVANIGNSAVDISSIEISGDFAWINHCPSSLAPNTRCSVAVMFNPRTTGTLNGTLTITPGDSQSPLSVQLSGMGANGPVAVLNPSSLSWPNQPFNNLSPPLTMTIMNAGTSELTISSIGYSAGEGFFGTNDHCLGVSVAPQSTCTIQFTYNPYFNYNANVYVTFYDNAYGGSQAVQLSGQGVPELVTFSNLGLKFADEPVGGASLPQTVYLINGLSSSITLNSIKAPADFFQSNNCGGTLGPGAYCALNVMFEPLSQGLHSEQLTVNDTGTGSPHILYLLGSGNGTVVKQSPTFTVDFFGDGEGEPAIWRPSDGTWYAHSNTGSNADLQQSLGDPGDVPEAADYDGDGQADFALFRPSNGTWYIIPSSSPTNTITTQWGAPDDVPVAADYDGDGVSDIAVWRPQNGTWYILPSDGGTPITKQWGEAGDVPVIGDYDGDGKADYAVFRPSNGTWYVSLSSTGESVTTPWGEPGDIPVEGDYDGDGKTDYAVWRPDTATWYVILSSTGQQISQPWGTLGDIPVVGDYNGDGKNDYAVFRPSNGTWYIQYSSGGGETVAWGQTGDIPATHLPSMYRRDKHIANFDGDRKADIGVFRPSTGTWYVIPSSTGKSTTQVFGENGDTIVPGDYDGDGKTDYAVWRPSNQTWYVIYSCSGNTFTQAWGASGDIPVPGDYDGDGKTDYAIWRPSTQTWWIILSSTGATVSRQLGVTGDIPVPGDYDGDGKTDYAVWNPSTGTFTVILSSTGQTVTQQWGVTGDIPVPGDYDGDGKADFAVFRPSNGTWYILQSSNGKTVTTAFGKNGDVPVAKDYDGDEKTDIAVFRPSNATWYILQSSNGQVVATQWGTSTDVPVNKPTGQ